MTDATKDNSGKQKNQGRKSRKGGSGGGSPPATPSPVAPPAETTALDRPAEEPSPTDKAAIPAAYVSGGSGAPGKPPSDVAAVEGEPEWRKSGRRKVGYCQPPVDCQFRKGKSGNPSGRPKKKRLPRHIGNQIDAITEAFISEINLLMMGKASELPPKGDYMGARLFARFMYKEAMTKDGFARRQVWSLYSERRSELTFFQPKDKTQRDAEQMGRMINAIIDPRVKDKEFRQLMGEFEKEDDDWYM